MSDPSPVQPSVSAPCPDAWALPESPLPGAGEVVEALCWTPGDAARWVTCVQAIAADPPMFDADPWHCTAGLSFDSE